jgi:hypothetical protein
MIYLFIFFGVPQWNGISYPQSPKTIKLVAQGEPSPRGGIFGNIGAISFNDKEDLVFKSEIESFKGAIFLNSGDIISSIIADGDSIAGLGKFNGIFSLGFTSINNEGTIAFSARLTNGSSVRDGLFLATAQGISPIVFHGDPITGGTLESPKLHTHSLNNVGVFAFEGFITPQPFKQAIFTSNGSTISKAVATGEVTPIGGTFEFGFLNFVDFNDNGTILFNCDIENGSSREGIFTVTNGVISKIVVQGDPSPDGKEFTYMDFSASINNLGDVIFEASVGEDFGTDYDGIFLNSNGAISLVVKSGAPAPGGGTLYGFSNLLINDEKQIVFQASIEGGNAVSGIFTVTSEGIQKIAVTGETAPIGGNYSAFYTPLLNSGGSVAFFSYTDELPASSGIFLWNGGPRLELSRDTVEFNDVVPGQTARLGLDISNSGGKTLEVQEITISPSPPYGLENVPSLPLLLQPEQSNELVVTYSTPEGNSVNLSKILEALENGSLTIKTNAPHPTTTLPVIAPSTNLRVDIVPSEGTEIKAGQFATIEIKVVDQSNNLVDFDGGATITLLESQSTPGITRLPQTQSVLITDGAAQSVFFLTPKEPFATDKPINDNTVLAGKAVIEVKLENSNIPSVTKTIDVKSPLDFFIDRIEVQQGVRNTDKDVFQEYMPGVSRTFSALPFIAEHNTIVQIFVGLNNPTFVPFSEIELGGITGDLKLLLDGNPVKTFENMKSGSFGTRNFTFKSLYTSIEQENMQDVLVAYLDHSEVRNKGSYTFDAELKPGSKLDEVNDVKENNLKSYTASFDETRLLRILSYIGKKADVSVDEINPSIWNFLKDVYPVQNSRAVFTDPNRRIYTFSGGFVFSDLKFKTLRGLLDRYNKENPDNQCVVLLMFAPLDICQEICSNPNSGGCAESINGKVGLITPGDAHGTAHEIGHMLGLRDTYKTDKYATDDGEPNPRRSNATNSGNPVENGNIHLITREKVVEGINRFEFMGSGLGIDRTTWNYLYQKLFSINSGNPIIASKQNSENGFIAVSGMIDTNNAVTFNPSLTLTQVPAVSESGDGDYSLEFQNNLAQVLSSLPFDVEFSIPDAGEQPEVPFSFYLPFPEGTSKLIMKKNNIEIASRTFSTNAPVVQLISPQSGETIKGTKTIVWTASDADGDKLTYDLIYSVDGNEQNILAVNLEDTSYVWESNIYPYSPSATLTIVANDGFNEGKFTADNLFFDSPVDVDSKEEQIPTEYSLKQNYPNPFNPSTTIQYELPQTSHVKLILYDILGNKVRTLIDDQVQPGVHFIELNAEGLASGVYLLNFITQDYQRTIKLIVAK